MKHLLFLLTALVLLTFAGTVHAQFISWSGTSRITDDSDVLTNGSYVDAFQAAPSGGYSKDSVVETVNTVAFNPNLADFTDGVISISSGNGLGDGSDGDYFAGSPSAAYSAVLADCAYTGGVGTVTLGSVLHPLTVGAQYQVQVWNSTPYDATSYIGSSPTDSVTALVGTYVVGTFTAGATTASFTFGAPPSGTPSTSGAYVVDAISLREVPEPSTYAMIGLGVVSLLAFARFHKLTA